MDTIDRKIVELRAQDQSLRQIGRAVSMSHVAVLKRLKRMGPTPEPEAGLPTQDDELPPDVGRERTIKLVEQTDEYRVYSADDALGNIFDELDTLLNRAAAHIRRQMGLVPEDEVSIKTPAGWHIEKRTDA